MGENDGKNGENPAVALKPYFNQKDVRYLKKRDFFYKKRGF